MKNIILLLGLFLCRTAFSQSHTNEYDKAERNTVRNFPNGDRITIKRDAMGNPLKIIRTSHCDNLPKFIVSPSGSLTACLGDTVLLTADSITGAHYIWCNNDSTRTIKVKASGSYSCTVVYPDGCRKASDVVNIIFKPLPNDSISLSKAKLCNGLDTLILFTSSNNQYTWNTGSTNASIYISDTGRYSVKITDNFGCVIRDTVQIDRFYKIPIFATCTDTILCPSEITDLITNPGFTNYKWNTGAITPTLSVNISGSFFVTALDSNQCSVMSKSIKVNSVSGPTPVITQNTALLCTTTPFVTYQWSTSPSATSMCSAFPSFGNHSVTVTDANGCSGSATANVVNNNCLPLAGTYTIGGANPDFANINDAVSALMSCGIKQSVLCNIRSGSYYRSMNFTDSIAGASATNTITFRSEVGIADSVKIFSDTTLAFHLLMNKTKYVSFEKVRFEVVKGVSTTNHIILSNAEFIKFVSCKFNSLNTSTYNTHQIYVKKSKNISFDDFRVLVTTPQIYLKIDSTSSRIKVLNSYFNFLNTYNSVKNLDVQKSTIVNMNTTSYTDSIYLFSDTIKYFALVSNNIIADSNFFENGSTIVGKYNRITRNVFNSGIGNFGGDSCLIANNIIINVGNSSGLYSTAKNSKIYNNTFSWRSVNFSNTNMVSILGAGSEFKNNIVDGRSMFITPLVLGLNVVSDYNLLLNFASKPMIVRNGFSFSDLYTWQRYSGMDMHSIRDSVLFIGSGDYHVKPGSIHDNVGLSLSLVNKDKEGIVRSTILPDLGAYEFGSVPNCDSFATISATRDTVCPNSSIELFGSNSDSYSWLPSGNFNGANTSSIIVTPSVTTTYTLVSTKSGCIDTAFKKIVVNPLWSNTISSSYAISQSGQSLCVSPALSGQHYEWIYSGNNIYQDASCVSAVGIGDYKVRVIDVNKCSYYVQKSVTSYSCMPLAGSYSIGGATPNFTTIESAKSALYNCGISSPVVFNIRNGKYNSSILLNDSIFGSSTINTVTFRSENSLADSVVVLGDQSYNSNVSVIKCNNLIFDRLCFQFEKLPIDGEHFIVKNSSNVYFKNCKFFSPTSSIVTYSKNLKFLKCSNISFYNNQIRGGGQSISTIFDTISNALIDSNIVNDVSLRGESKNIRCAKNKMNTFSTSGKVQYAFFYGDSCSSFSLSNLRNSRIDSCKATSTITCSNCVVDTVIKNIAGQIYMASGDTNIVVNNMVKGQLYSASNRTKIWFNTVNMSVSFLVSGNNAGTFSGLDVSVKNNIFKTNSPAYPCVQYANTVISDYNIYAKTVGGNLINRNGVNYTSLASYKASTTNDVNSRDDTVRFVSNADLHIAGAVTDNVGTNVGIVSDIDNQVRSLTTPDIGADEFTINVAYKTDNEPSAIKEREKIASNMLHISPNPTKGILLISYDGEIYDGAELSIVSEEGKLLSKTQLHTVEKYRDEINIQYFSSGVYFVIFYTGRNQLIERIIKE